MNTASNRVSNCWLLSISAALAIRPAPRRSEELEEDAEAAAGESADNGGGDGVLQTAETGSGEAAENEGANTSKDVGVRGDFEFFISHDCHSSFVPRAAPVFLAFWRFRLPPVRRTRHFDAG
jgi:hypothetical protein